MADTYVKERGLVYDVAYDLASFIEDKITRFPKNYKFSLGFELSHDAIKIVTLLNMANRTYDDISAVKLISQALIVLEKIKIELRLALDKGLINIQVKTVTDKMINSIEKQGSKWRKFKEKNQSLDNKVIFSESEFNILD